jgi:predicted ATPase
MKTLLLTGGPLGGKSTVLGALSPDPMILVRKEAATTILEHGFHEVGERLGFNDDWKRLVQPIINQLNQSTLDAYKLLDGPERLLVCDRGELDGVAYYPGGMGAYLNDFNLHRLNIFALYDTVIHLETLAAHDPALYERLCKTNAVRYDTVTEAVERDRLIREAYGKHPLYQFVPAWWPLTDKIALVRRIAEHLIEKDTQEPASLPGSYTVKRERTHPLALPEVG